MASENLFDGVAAEAFALELVDQFSHFLRAAEIANQQRVGGVDDDGILDAKQDN